MIGKYIKCLFFGVGVILLQLFSEYIVTIFLTNLYVDKTIVLYLTRLLGLLFTILVLLIFQREYIISCFKLLKCDKTVTILFLSLFLFVVIGFVVMSSISVKYGALSCNEEVVERDFYEFLIFSLLVSLDEEFLFRGIILGFIKSKIGYALAIIISSLLFLCVHPYYSGIAPYITGFIAACIFALLTLKYKSLLPSVGFHAGWNFSYFITQKYYVADSIVPIWGNLFEIPQIIFLSIIFILLLFSDKIVLKLKL